MLLRKPGPPISQTHFSGHVQSRLEFALALDIREIREEALSGFEAALIARPERDIGAILINLSSDLPRQRFSIGHELGHFPLAGHVLNQPDGFRCCSSGDMVEQDANVARYEAEANRLAIELLAPPAMVGPALAGVPDLETVRRLGKRLEISVAAATRRYVERHDERLAMLVCREGVVAYMVKGAGFPFLLAGRGAHVPLPSASPDRLTAMEVVDSRDWLSKPDGIELSVQTLHQRDGHSISLLQAVTDADE